jgi:molybdenum cofactor cytidylyltransferase
MLFARLGNMRVLGIPGSARSPRLHGFDWVLQRLVAGLTVTPRDLTRMGVGGLLKEIPGRPMPREQEEIDDMIDDAVKSVGAVLLAAGQSRRMGRENKMLVEIDGAPMVLHAARALIASRAAPVVVVLGHEAESVEAALTGLDVIFVGNPDYADGLSTSLRTGLSALPNEAPGAIIALGDMPGVTDADIDSLIAAFDPTAHHSICVPTHDGKRGNPVLWARRYFTEMASVAGDVGARHLIGENADQVIEVTRDNPGILIDLDTPEAVASHRRGA